MIKLKWAFYDGKDKLMVKNRGDGWMDGWKLKVNTISHVVNIDVNNA